MATEKVPFVHMETMETFQGESQEADEIKNTAVAGYRSWIP